MRCGLPRDTTGTTPRSPPSSMSSSPTARSSPRWGTTTTSAPGQQEQGLQPSGRRPDRADVPELRRPECARTVSAGRHRRAGQCERRLPRPPRFAARRRPHRPAAAEQRLSRPGTRSPVRGACRCVMHTARRALGGVKGGRGGLPVRYEVVGRGVTAIQEAGVPTGRRRRTGGSTAEESVLRVNGPPIFAALALQWHQAGRIVPGQHDREWSALVAAAPGAGGH